MLLGWSTDRSCDASAMPATECVRGGERWPIVLAAQHGELVTQDDDLDVFGAPEPDGETGQRREETVLDAICTPQHRRVLTTFWRARP